MEPLFAEALDRLSDLVRMRNRRVGKVPAGRFARIDAALSVDVIEALGTVVVGLERPVVDRPRR